MTTSTRARIRWIVTLTLLGLIVLVGLQNIREAEISVLFWTFRMPLIVVIVLSYAAGVVVGWLWWPFTTSRAEGHRD
jgi:uncharacterized integral membrane protein